MTERELEVFKMEMRARKEVYGEGVKSREDGMKGIIYPLILTLLTLLITSIFSII